MNYYTKLSSPELLNEQMDQFSYAPLKVNGHFHTPYSFSAFENLEQVMKMAVSEHVDVIGINDFYTTQGYDEFAELAKKYRKFPLFNIEFMGLLKQEQQSGIRVNDPINPGRTYFSGKGLDYPFSLSGDSLEKLKSVRQESDLQSRSMVEKASEYLTRIDSELELDYDQILKDHTHGMVRERHIARVIRIKVFEKYESDEARRAILKEIYNGNDSVADLSSNTSVDGEIRSNLLKSGGAAFVPEDPKAFLEIQEIIRIILDAGGIPCYPVLLDDKNGNYTDYESDPKKLFKSLTGMNVWSLELIPGRNRISNLRSFVEYFDKQGFVITFGTEHNTPDLIPLEVSAGDSKLDDYLMKVNYEGACITAAHQYMRSFGKPGYVNDQGKVIGSREEFVALGNAVIKDFIKE